jgi:hypothetical protein
MKKNGMRPVPPGEILNEEFLKPLGLSLVQPASRKTDRDREHVTLNSTAHAHKHEARTRIPQPDHGDSEA